MFSADKHIFDFRNNCVTTRNKCEYKWKSSPICRITKTFIIIIVIEAKNSYCSVGCCYRLFYSALWNWLLFLPAEDEISKRS